MKKINCFEGEWRFLSNFHPSPITIEGRSYPTVEHAFQALKSLEDADREMVRMASTPGEAKKLGRKVKLRPDWEEVKTAVMKKCVTEKFKNEPLRSWLCVGTRGYELEEGNTWNDKVWGTVNGVGENRLGKILMEVRKELEVK